MKGATSIQERLWELRKDKGLNLEELSKLTGISKSALGSYEKEDFKAVSYTHLTGQLQNQSHPHLHHIRSSGNACPASCWGSYRCGTDVYKRQIVCGFINRVYASAVLVKYNIITVHFICVYHQITP